MIAVSEWLGAEYKTKGVNRALTDRIKGILVAASTQGLWDLDDVPSLLYGVLYPTIMRTRCICCEEF